MSRFQFVWNAATSFTKLTLTLMEKDSADNYPISDKPVDVKRVMDWISVVGWEKLSCMDESIFMEATERSEWVKERETSPNDWSDYLSAVSHVYEKAVERGEPTNLIWDHMLSLSLAAWESSDDANTIKSIAGTADADLQTDGRIHIKESIRALKRIRQAELDPEADKKIDQDDDDAAAAAAGGGGDDDDLDDDVLLGLQSKMKDMLGKIQDPKSGLGKLMHEIMEDLKNEKIDLDPKTLMDVCMKGMVGGASGGGLDAMKDGPLGKIMAIVEKKVKDKIAAGGMDDLKGILESTQDLFGKDPADMKKTLMKLLLGMIKKMGLPKQVSNMLFSKMNGIIEKMTSSMMSGDGPAPNQEEMQNMLSQSMDGVMKDLMRQSGANISKRKMERMAPKLQQRRRDPRLEQLEKLKERLRKKHAENQKKKQGGDKKD